MSGEAHAFVESPRWPGECLACGRVKDAGCHYMPKAPQATPAAVRAGDLNTRAFLECEKWRFLACAASATLVLVDRCLERWEDGGPAKRIPAQDTDADVLQERVGMGLAAAELAGVGNRGRESAGEARHG